MVSRNCTLSATLSALLILCSTLASPVIAAPDTRDFFPIEMRGQRYDVGGPGCDVQFTAPDGFAIIGMGLRASDGKITTMRVSVQRINPDGTLGEIREMRRGSEPNHYPEGIVGVPAGYVAVGFGINVIEWWDVGVLSIWGARLSRDGSLGTPEEFRSGFTPTAETEKQILLPEGRLLTGLGISVEDHNVTEIMAQSATCSRYPLPEEQVRKGVYLSGRDLKVSSRTRQKCFAPENHVITEIIMRCAEGDITTMTTMVRPVLADGTLGAPVANPGSWQPFYEPEAHITLPDGYVAVGIGLNITPIADVGALCIFAAPLRTDGTLGPTEEFRMGFIPDPNAPLEKVVMAGPGEVLTGYGFLIDNDNVLGIMGTSAKIVRAE